MVFIIYVIVLGHVIETAHEIMIVETEKQYMITIMDNLAGMYQLIFNSNIIMAIEVFLTGPSIDGNF